MKIDTSWGANRKSLIAVIFGLSILTAINIFNLGIIDGIIVGGIIGTIVYFVFDKILPKAKQEIQETKEETKK